MIIVRESFIAKPGMASKLARLMKEAADLIGDKSRVMTDLTGAFNKVVMETEFENVGEFEKRMQKYKENQEVRNKMAGYTEMFQAGSRELYEVL